MVGGEVGEPVLVRPLSAALTAPVIVIKAVSFFQEPKVDEGVDVANDRPSRHPPGVRYGLVAGEALIGLSIPVGEDNGERPPNRSTDQGEVAFGQLLKDD